MKNIYVVKNELNSDLLEVFSNDRKALLFCDHAMIPGDIIDFRIRIRDTGSALVWKDGKQDILLKVRKMEVL